MIQVSKVIVRNEMMVLEDNRSNILSESNKGKATMSESNEKIEETVTQRQ